MSLGLVGRKVGMMRIFKDDGTSVPVTVLDCSGNRVAQVKSQEADGYVAVQVAFGSPPEEVTKDPAVVAAGVRLRDSLVAIKLLQEEHGRPIEALANQSRDLELIATVAAVGRTTLSFVIALLLAVPAVWFQYEGLWRDDDAEGRE